MPRLKYKNANKNAKKSYRPAKALENLIRGWLQYRDDAGEITREQIDKENTRLKKKKSLYKRKVTVLNRYIFPAMANLTVLVEAMQEQSYIREKFEDDLRALFLTKSSKPSKNNKSIFERFIAASCTLRSAKEYRTRKMILSPDFRLVLIDIMQRVIYRKMGVIGPLKFKTSQSWKKTLKLDMERAAARTREIAHEALIKEMTDEAYRKKHSETVGRPPQF